MQIFVTGATGYINNNPAEKLAAEGNSVHTLSRDVRTKMLNHPNIKIFGGDITNVSSIQKAMQGCVQVYHLAAYARVLRKILQLTIN